MWSRLQRSEQNFTPCHVNAHFLRHTIGRPHTTQHLRGRLAFWFMLTLPLSNGGVNGAPFLDAFHQTVQVANQFHVPNRPAHPCQSGAAGPDRDVCRQQGAQFAQSLHRLLFVECRTEGQRHHFHLACVLRDRQAYGPVTLYFGVRTPDSFAYADELDHWEASGIRVVRTVSRPGASGWQGLTGYVQAHLGEEPVEDTLAFVCGQSGMVQGVMDALRGRGLTREAIHLNY